MRHAPAATRPDALVEEATAVLAAPALVVVAGGPGSGRSTVLATLGAAFRGPVFAGGGLAMLQAVPAFALTRAVRVRLPAADPSLLAEAVRSRVRGGLLLLDDLQWADPATLSALPVIAAHCRVAVALRTPHRLPEGAVAELRAAAADWLSLPPLSAEEAADLARRVAPGLAAGAVAAVVARAGGVPLAVETLARHAAARGTADVAGDAAQVEHAVAAALADLTRPARTAMAALGLLGRPATAAVLGAGVDELLDAGLVTLADDELAPVSPYLAEVAAGLLDQPGREALHRRLASLVPPREAARHLAAAGDGLAAYQVAVAAAGRMTTAGERAELLLLACDLPGVDPEPDVRIAAASAALACGRPRAAVRVLTTGPPGAGSASPRGSAPSSVGAPASQLDSRPASPTGPLGVDAAVLRAEALLQVGDVAAARDAAAPVPDGAARDIVAARDRVLLLARLAEDPAEATAAAARIAARHGDPPDHAGLRAALAAVRAHARADGWEYGLASATAAAGAAGDLLAARWSAWLLVETLAADGRLAEAAQAAGSAAQACAADLAYSWQTRFLAAELWCTALRGASTDDVVRRAGDLTDRTLPALALGYATAAASLVEADGGLLAPARSRLAGVAGVVAPSALLDWVGREAAWLDGQPDLALRPAHADLSRAGALVAGLHEITARWASADLGLTSTAVPAGKPAVDRAAAVAATLEAWTAAGGFDRAAAAWHDLAVREEVRCLLAQGLHETDPALAVPPLLAAERLAEQAGLVVLLGRARRALRRHAVRRDQRGPRAGTELTDRERDVLRLVAAGEPTRRIAGQLGISGETVETHIRSGMRKLGARTRTEAAARLGQLT